MVAVVGMGVVMVVGRIGLWRVFMAFIGEREREPVDGGGIGCGCEMSGV
jgi:hypothetical protein